MAGSGRDWKLYHPVGPGGEPGLWCETVQLDGGPHGLPTSQEGVGDRPVSHGERVVDGALTDQEKR